MTDTAQDPANRTVEPCEHMVNTVNSLADGSLRGPMKLYTRMHTVHCSKCRDALTALKVLHNRLSALSIADTSGSEGLTRERQASIENAMDQIEQRGAAAE